jgi:hypothetical protein
MNVIIILLMGYDSLPPLPDLSRMDLPEPALWIETVPRELTIHGFAGEFYGVNLSFDINNFAAHGDFTRKNEWTNTDVGSMLFSYSMALPGLWLKPAFQAMLLRRRDEYTQVNPGIEFALFTAPFVAMGVIDYSRWSVTDEKSNESSGELCLIFDRMKYMPGIGMKGIFTEGELKPTLFARLHLHGFHVELGSLMRTGFPSPSLGLTFRSPWFEIGAGARVGVKHNTLSGFFDPDVPIRYSSSIPSETLNVAFEIRSQLTIHEQEFIFYGAYNQWHHRLDIGKNYGISSITDVEEMNLKIGARNQIRLKNIALSNVLQMQYNNADSAVPFLPEIGLVDTFELDIGPFALSSDLHYISKRNGIEKKLPSSYIINTTVGINIACTELYCRVHNITDERSEIYDGYYYTGRQFAGGIEIKQRF